MSRTYTADSLVILPRASALSTARLIQELRRAAKAEKKLPAALAADQPELEDAYAALQVELAKRITAEGDLPPVIRAADLVEDNAFGAFHGWLSAWARLPADKHPEAAEAAEALQTLFPHKLSFLTIRPEDEWQEAEEDRTTKADRAVQGAPRSRFSQAFAPGSPRPKGRQPRRAARRAHLRLGPLVSDALTPPRTTLGRAPA